MSCKCINGTHYKPTFKIFHSNARRYDGTPKSATLLCPNSTIFLHFETSLLTTEKFNYCRLNFRSGIKPYFYGTTYINNI
ncbi:putative arginyl-tRNA--protein transferase 1 isoform X3 [Sesbania bispinosa]|nr:putative arginyl-tRNA--protein transferase 1 isoform X3 [Sesbania bispinosa]